MAEVIAIKFTLADATEVDFYQGEIGIETLSYIQTTIVQQKQVALPYVDVQGNQYKALGIDFIINQPNAIDRIDQLIDAEAEMTCYYAYQRFSTSRSVLCIYLPEEKTHTYNYYVGGEKIYDEHVKLTFLQTS